MNTRRIIPIGALAVVFASAALLAGCGGGGGTPARSGSQVQVAPPPSAPATPSNARHGAIYSYYENGHKYFNYRYQFNTQEAARSSALSRCGEDSSRTRCEFVTTFTNCASLGWSGDRSVQAYATGNSLSSARSSVLERCSQLGGTSCESTDGNTHCINPVTTQASKSGGIRNVRYGAIYSYYDSNEHKRFSWHNQRNTAAEIERVALSHCMGVSGRSRCEPVTTFTNCAALARSSDFLVRSYATGDTLDTAGSAARAECSRLRDSSCEVPSGHAICNNPVTTQASKSGGHNNTPSAPSGSNVRYGAVYSYYDSRGKRFTSLTNRGSTEAEAERAALSDCRSDSSRTRCEVEDTFTNCASLVRSGDTSVRAYGTGDTLSSAQSAAQAECSQLGGSSCNLDGSGGICNTPVTAQIAKTGGVRDVRYGAIFTAFASDGTRRIGYGIGDNTEREASDTVLSACRKSLSRCVIEDTFTNCAALATDGSGSIGAYGTGDTLSNARTEAEAECSRLGGSSCRVASGNARCNSPVTSQASKIGGFNLSTPSAPSGSNVQNGAVYSFYSGGQKLFGSVVRRDTVAGIRSYALSRCREDSSRTRCNVEDTFTNCAAFATSSDGSTATYATGNTPLLARGTAAALCGQRSGSSCSAAGSGNCVNPVRNQASKSGVIGGLIGFVLSAGIGYDVRIGTQAEIETHCRRIGCRILETFTACGATAGPDLRILPNPGRPSYGTGDSTAIAQSAAFARCSNTLFCNIQKSICLPHIR